MDVQCSSGSPHCHNDISLDQIVASYMCSLHECYGNWLVVFYIITEKHKPTQLSAWLGSLLILQREVGTARPLPQPWLLVVEKTLTLLTRRSVNILQICWRSYRTLRSWHAWDLYSKDIITVDEREAACYHMHSRGMRTSSLLSAVESKIVVNPGAFDVFLSVLAKRSSMSDLCRRMNDTYSKSVRQASLDGSRNLEYRIVFVNHS